MWIAVAAAFLVGLALIVGRVAWFDPYWIVQRKPPWLAETGGANRLLDRQTRRTKVLQALTRSYSLALIGSSTVYHGLDPADVETVPRGEVFNAGISAILAEELPLIAAVVASRAQTTRVALGLDYYMFARTNVPVRLSPALATAPGRWNALLGAFISEQAFGDSWREQVIGGGEDPGTWTYDGYRITPKLSVALTRQNDRTRRRTTTTYRPETIKSFELAIEALDGRRVDVYLAPVSAAQRRVMEDLGLMSDFARWRRDIVEAGARAGVPVADLIDLGAAFPFDPEAGSTDAWLDNLHFTPVIGRIVLQTLGLRAADRAPLGEPHRSAGN